MWNGLIVWFQTNKNKTKKNKIIDKREGGDQRNEGGRKKTMVIITKLGVFATSYMLKG